MAVSGKRYRAFISYSQKDRAQARRLQRAMEAFKAPKGVMADGLDPKTRRLGRFFRDEEDLGAAADLTDTLQEQIASADCLIVVCSPHAAQSVWVNREIIHFKRTGRADRIFAVIVDGEPHAAASNNVERRKTECFPPALKVRVDAGGALTDQPEEPLAIDLRKDGFARTRARLAAGMLDVNFDDLWRRDQRRARARAMALAASTLVAAAAVGGLTWWVADRSQKAGDLALFAEQAKTAVDDAETIGERTLSSAVGSKAPDTAPVVAAQWRATRMAYALSLSGRAEAAKPLLERLGHMKGTALSPAAYLMPGKGMAFAYGAAPDRRVRLFDLVGGADKAMSAGDQALSYVSPDERWVALAEYGQDLTIWDMATGAKAWTIPADAQTHEILSPGFAHAGDVVAIVGRNRFWLYDAATGEKREANPFPLAADALPPTVYDVAFSLDDALVYILTSGHGASEGQLLIWDRTAKAWRPAVPIPGMRFVTHVMAGHDNSHAIVQGEVGDVEAMAVIDSAGKSPPHLLLPTLCQNPAGVTDAPTLPEVCQGLSYSVSVDARTLLIAGSRKGVTLATIFNLVTQAQTMLMLPQCLAGDAVDGLCDLSQAVLSPVGPVMAIVRGYKTVYLIDTASGVARALPGEMNFTGLTFSGDGKRLIAVGPPAHLAGNHGQVWVWDVASGQIISKAGVSSAVGGAALANEDGSVLLLPGAASYSEPAFYVIWRALYPVGQESPAQALRRVCGMKGAEGLKLAPDELKLLPDSTTRPADLCQWKYN